MTASRQVNSLNHRIFNSELIRNAMQAARSVPSCRIANAAITGVGLLLLCPFDAHSTAKPDGLVAVRRGTVPSQGGADVRRGPGPVAAAVDAVGVLGVGGAKVDEGIKAGARARRIAAAVDVGDPFRHVAAEVLDAGDGDVLR